MTLFSEAEALVERAIALATCEADLDLVISWPEADLPILFAATDLIRRHFHSGNVDPCSLLNIKSGNCSEDCAFCSQSAHNDAEVRISPLASPEEIQAAYAAAKKQDLSFCVVSAGRKLSPAEITSVASTLKDCGPAHASLGILSDEEFAELKAAGITCYNHNIETSERYYPHIVTTHSWQQRVDTVRRAKAAGINACSGGIFGMGETWEDRKDMCRVLKELDVHTVPLNFLNPIPGTRMGMPAEGPMDFLRIVALFRVALPDKLIKVCGGRELHLGKLQGLMFLAGANGYVAGNYLTTTGDSIESDDAMIAALHLSKNPQ